MGKYSLRGRRKSTRFRINIRKTPSERVKLPNYEHVSIRRRMERTSVWHTLFARSARSRSEHRLVDAAFLGDTVAVRDKVSGGCVATGARQLVVTRAGNEIFLVRAGETSAVSKSVLV